jgi:hypothetical protein
MHAQLVVYPHSTLGQNHLTYIPPEITSLRNLRDLNIAGNRLEYLPAEMLNMSLTQLQVFPNPFMEPPSAVTANTISQKSFRLWKWPFVHFYLPRPQIPENASWKIIMICRWMNVRLIPHLASMPRPGNGSFLFPYLVICV